MIFIYCGRPSRGAYLLNEYLNDNGAPTKRGKSFPYNPGDLVINWGVPQRFPREWRVLNRNFIGDKLHDLRALEAAGVPCPRTSLIKRPGYIARRSMHEDGNDLGRSEGDYYTEFIPTIGECRVNSFRGVSLAAALKIPRPGYESPDPRFRTYSRGWKFSYREADRDRIPASARPTAHRAVAAVGLDFGAVDLGITKEQKVVVFEVNSAPGIDGWEVEAYGDAIILVAKERR